MLGVEWSVTTHKSVSRGHHLLQDEMRSKIYRGKSDNLSTCYRAHGIRNRDIDYRARREPTPEYKCN